MTADTASDARGTDAGVTWVAVGTPAEVTKKRRVVIKEDGHEVLVLAHDGRFYGFQNLCIHKDRELSKGVVLNGKLVCPGHQWAFALETGYEAVKEQCQPTYQVRVNDDTVEVALPVGSVAARLGATTVDAPAPAGPYSQSVRKGNIVAAAGQVGRLPDGTWAEGVGEQTRQAIRNLLAVLDASGAVEADIISVRVFLTDPQHFDEMNRVYAEMLSEPYPARTTVYVRLREHMLVELDALAVIG
jgi:2-iminobutanoate/2-iminopropanoate deaminase